MTDPAWIFLADEQVGLRVSAEWAARPSIFVPERKRFDIVAAGVNPTPEPARPVEYRRTFPARWQLVVDEDVTIRAGEPLNGSATEVKYAEAIVFERAA